LELSKSPQDDKHYKKPNLPPKPGKFPPNSVSAYSLKNLGAINEERALDENMEPSQQDSTNGPIKSLSTHEPIVPFSSDSGTLTETTVTNENNSPMLFKRSNSLNSMALDEYSTRSVGKPDWVNKTPDRWSLNKGTPPQNNASVSMSQRKVTV